MASKTGSAIIFFVYIIARLCGPVFSQNDPVIVPDKIVTTLYQYEASSRQLFRLTCVTDPPGGTCSISIRYVQPTHPCGASCFVLLPNCGGDPDVYCLWFVPGQGYFNPQLEPQYLLSLEARDANKRTSQRLVDVRISTNSPPVFDHGGQSMITVELFKSDEKKAGTVLATVSATDANNDPLTFSMTTVPDTPEIVINPQSGEVRTTKDLRTMCVTALTCLVTVQDPYSGPVGPFVLNLVFKNNNIPPIITNLDTDLYLREDKQANDLVLHFDAFDENPSPDSYSFTTVPPDMQDYFFVKDNNLKLKKQVDYETHPHLIIMYIQASDGYCTSKVYTLNIRLVDINEPPILLPADQIIDTCEGWVDIRPKWDVSDPDEGDTWTFTDVQPNQFGRFKIHKTSGVISTALDYDLDESRHPSSVALIVTVSDQQLLTATASLSVRFIDCNDSPPLFPKAFKVMSVTPCDNLGKVIAAVPKAQDADSDFRQNNIITYSAGSGTGGLVSVDLDGNVVLESAFQQGQYVTFPVYATDKGEHPRPLTSPSPVWIAVYAEKCKRYQLRTTTSGSDLTTSNLSTTPATAGPNLADDWDSNQAWLITAGLLGVVLVVLAMIMFCRYGWSRCRQSCRGSDNSSSNSHSKGTKGYRGERSRLPEQQWGYMGYPVRRPFQIPRKSRPGFIFGWWKEQYGNHDFGKKAVNRDTVPAPSQGVDPAYTHTYDAGD